MAEGRKPAQTDAERAQLLRTMAAWTGRYRVEGNKLLVKIDASWSENDTGKEYLRTFVLDGNRLHDHNGHAIQQLFPRPTGLRQ